MRVYRINNQRAFVPAGTETVKLGNGQRAVPGLHDVVQLWDGSWELAHRTARLRVGGVDVVYKKGTPVSDIISSNWWRDQARRRILSVAEALLLGRPTTENAERQLDRACAYALANTMGYSRVSVEGAGYLFVVPQSREFAAPFSAHVAGWKKAAEGNALGGESVAGPYLAEVLAQWMEDRMQALSVERAMREAQAEAYAVAA